MPPQQGGLSQVSHAGSRVRRLPISHEAVGAHAQGLPDQVAQRHLAGALHVGRAGLEPDDVRVLRQQLSGVLDEQQPLSRRDERQQRSQERGLAGPGTAALVPSNPGRAVEPSLRASALGETPCSLRPGA